MRVIKLGIISIVFFTIFLTLLSLLFPSRIRISKAIDISATEDSIIARLNDRHNWYPFADSIGLFGKGNDAMVVPDTSANPVSTQIVLLGGDFPDPKLKASGWNLLHSNDPGKISLQWYMDFKLRWYPWEKFTGLLLEKRYGPALENALGKLKTALEK